MKRSVQLLIVVISAFSLLLAANNSIQFDGVNDYVSLGSSSDLRPSSGLTLELWANPGSYTGHVAMEALAGNTQDGGYSLTIGNSGSKVKFIINVGGTYYNLEFDASSLTGWHHFAGTFDGRYVKLYSDGNLVGTHDIGSTGNTIYYGHSNAFMIAAEAGTASSPEAGYYYDGKMDELRIWNDARSETEIRQNMYRELADPTSEGNLLAYYKFNETFSATTADSKGSYTGTLQNMTGEEFVTSSAIFGPKNCLDFDGNDDYIAISDLKMSGSAFTLETWIKFDSFNGGADANITNVFRGGGENIVLRMGDGDKPNNMPQFVVMIGGTQYKLNANARLSTNTWYHIAAVYDGSLMSLYIDGELDLSQGRSGTLSTTSEEFRLGGDSGGRKLEGLMDEVRIWSDARTQSEIRQYMCKSLDGNESDLLAYYNGDHIIYNSSTEHNELPDYSQNAKDGIAVNGTTTASSNAFNTWLNTGSTSWSEGSNWSIGSSPASSENAGIYEFSGGAKPGLGDINTLVLGSSVSMTATSTFSVNHKLILNGDLDLNGQIVTLGSSAKLHEDSGRLYGASGSITTTRDLNNINENVGGLGTEITTSANMGSTVITRSHSANVSPAGIERKYSITPTNNSGLNASLIFHYHDDELNGLAESYLELYRSVDGGTNWTDVNGTVNSFSNTITLSGIDAFSLWTAMESEDVTPPVLETQNPSQSYASGNTAITIAPSTTVTTSSTIDNATVSLSPIVSGDILSVSDLPAGLSSSWDNSTKILSISGSGTATDYQTALRNVKFNTTTSTDGVREIDFILGDGVGLMIDDEQHFYEVIDNVSNVSWDNARASALASRFGEAQGYLATVTSSTENNYLAEKVSADTWIGASDYEIEGIWKWIDGPEHGTQFWLGDVDAGNSSTSNYGSAVNGEYDNWWSTEPNNAYGSFGEDYAHMYGSTSGQPGYWNDYYGGYSVRYYIIEYGGDGSTFTTIDNAQVTVSVQASLTTAEASAVTSNSADLGGNITSNGGESVDERGVVYSSTDTEPEIGDVGVSKNANGSGTGSFSETITELLPNTTYYYQAYATNDAGTSYGGVQSFTTQESATAIELVSYIALPVNDKIKLEWQTASETENLGFILERKTDDQDWELVATYLDCEALVGQGTSSDNHNYQWSDDNVYPGKAYHYRLSDVEMDGRITLHGTLEVRAASGIAATYPNPFNPTLQISFGLAKDQDVRLEIYDILGRQVETIVDGYLSQGQHHYHWQPHKLSSGVYFIHLSSDDVTSIEKVMYMK